MNPYLAASAPGGMPAAGSLLPTAAAVGPPSQGNELLKC